MRSEIEVVLVKMRQPSASEEWLTEEPNANELNSLRNDPLKLATIRLRLSDIAWWMRLLCQHIATWANLEDQELGKGHDLWVVCSA